MIEPYDDSQKRAGRITLHDEQDSMAKLVNRQADAMKTLREQRDELLEAAKKVEFSLRASVTINTNEVRDALAEILRAAIKKTEASRHAHT